MIVISSEMEEVLGISDRIAVMHEGRLTGIRAFTVQRRGVMRLATGTKDSHKRHKKSQKVTARLTY